MKLLVEMFEKKDYENTNGLSDRKLKELFDKKFRAVLRLRNCDKITIRLVKNGK